MKHFNVMLLLAAGSLFGADVLSGPIAGYVAGSPRPELRAILGVPGAYRFSEPLALPDGVTRIRMAPGQEFALVERAQAAPGVMMLKGGAVDGLIALEGVMTAADLVAFSAGGRAAVLYSAGAGRLQVVTGLPDAPRVAADLDAAALPDALESAAISDDGTLLVAASAQAVYVLPRAGAPRLILSGQQFRSVAVLPNGRDALIADAGLGSLHIVENAAATPAARLVASGLDDMGEVLASHDGGKAWVTRTGAMAVSVVDLASGEVRSVPSGVAPTMLLPLRNRDTFLISARPRQPGWVYYRDGQEGRVVFIPAVKATLRSVR